MELKKPIIDISLTGQSDFYLLKKRKYSENETAKQTTKA